MAETKDISTDKLEVINGDNVTSGLVFDVKRYAINDGPGIRITIFLKGCPLQCAWCHNPESISTKVQKMYSEAKCIGCSICVENCPEEACELTAEGIITDSEKCIVCGTCADNCPAMATEMSGKQETVASLMKKIEKERIFFDQSGGGVTISGGEPLMYPVFLMKLLDACGEKGIHRTVDTSGMAKTETLLEVAKKTDLFLYDLKLMDPEKHKKWTRVGNELILKNLQILAKSGARINIRLPLIKGVNEDPENIEQTAAFISSLEGEKKQVQLLPYHNIASMKYEKLGKDYNGASMKEPEETDLKRIIAQFENKGLEVVVGLDNFS